MNVQPADARVGDRAQATEIVRAARWHGTCLSAAANMLAAHPTSTAARGYARRQPETTVHYGVVHDHLPTLLDHARARSEHGFGYHASWSANFEKFLGTCDDT
jgi:hypothetical protein